MKKFSLNLLILIICCSITAEEAVLEPSARKEPSVGAKAAIIIDRETGKVLFEKAKDKRLPPASLTKVMTALIALESSSPQETVTIGQDILKVRLKKMGLKPGDSFILKDLITSMLLTSANDACIAVARHIGKTETGFVELMNEKASDMGLRNTHFTNPCGFDDPKHYSTAADLALLAEEALKDNRFAMIVRTPEMEIATVDRKKSFKLNNTNTNRLLAKPDITGVKTGFTNKAGHCLIATVFKGGKSLLLVGLGFKDRWQGAMELIDYGLEKSKEHRTISGQLTYSF